MEDEKIVGLYWQRSEEAIAETEAKYGRLCYSVAYGVLKNHEDSEECVNDTYVRTWNSIPPDQPDHLGAYVSKISRRLALDKLRRKTADKRAAVTVVLDEISECLPDMSGGMTVDRMVTRETLNKFIGTLTPTNRVIFMRRYWYCDSVHDIAKMLHMTEAGVKMKLVRMRQKLKKELSGEGVEV